MDQSDIPSGSSNPPSSGGLNFDLKSIITSPLFWMAVGAGIVVFIQYKSKPVRQISQPAGRTIDV